MPRGKEQPTDIYIGKRVRMRRMQVGISQTELGDELGISFQQVQKYENGSNRLSASKLQLMATFLKVPVSFFFEGGPAESNHKKNASPEFTFANLLSTAQGLALCSAFEKIESKAVRTAVTSLVVALSAAQ
jgi:transcriptional regulator with XRE-family HTH domain